MELDLGPKVTRTKDDQTSYSELRFAKDNSGPSFLSRETESMYILTSSLKGYRKENISIGINEEGTQIAISGERPIQEMIILGWITRKKQAELNGFRKVFHIPQRVILDEIKAKFDDQECVLTVVMPKRKKGIFNDGIKEVEEVEPAAEAPEPIQKQEEQPAAWAPEPIQKQEEQPSAEAPEPIQKQEEQPEEKPRPKKRKPRKLKLCPPLMAAGSALLASIIFFLMNYIRDRKK